MSHDMEKDMMRNHLRRIAREENEFAVRDEFNRNKIWLVRRDGSRNYHMKQFLVIGGNISLTGSSYRYGLKMTVEVLMNGYGELIRDESFLKKLLTFKKK